MTKIRRRQGDKDWVGAEDREVWDGPSSQWGADVNTRLGQLELGQEELAKTLNENTQMTAEMYRIFKPGKTVGLGIIAAVVFFGWSGVVTVWNWIEKIFR